MLETRHNSCIACGSNQNLQEHHISYKPEIIICMCTGCHNLEHPGHGVGRARGYKVPYRPIGINYRIIEGKTIIKKRTRNHHSFFSYEYECIKEDGKMVRLFTHKRIPAQPSLIEFSSSG